jgi:hypothetical protein
MRRIVSALVVAGLMAASTLHVFPRVGLGNSLGRDPNTGRSYWTNLP